MLEIDKKNNNITITNGDTLTLTLALTKNKQPYTPAADDVIRFAISQGYRGETNYNLILEETVPNDTLTFTIDSERMKKLRYGTTYNYDVEVTFADGTVDTPISAQITTTGDAK